MYVPIPYVLLSMTDLCSDHAYLQHYGGMDKNSLNKIFQQYDINKEDTNEPDIMSNWSYYDIDDFIKLWITVNNFQYLVPTLNQSTQNLMNFKY